MEWTPKNKAELRGQAIDINPKLLGSNIPKENSLLLFPLFDKNRQTGRITKVHKNTGNILSITGKFNQDGNYFTISADTSQVRANLYLTRPQRYFRIYYSDTLGSHILVEIDLSKKDPLPESPPLSPPDSANFNDSH